MNDIIIFQLQRNLGVFQKLLQDISDIDICTWKPHKDKWCLLEVLCHLYDEEREDFRFRIKWVLEKPGVVPPPFDPTVWVKERNYMGQDYRQMLKKFLQEREESVKWLKSLENANWQNSYEHPTKGKITARYYLVNWLSHDYLHMRQIIKLKYDYIKEITGENLDYAGSLN
ncbi:DinB family protein [Leptobacterium flavescens]|uniref:DinB family protein n=1 Tax=Leptobacterium flavescens TaxID=472055 RepID=A0A6P0UG29_9FLAO|nr:DinB family protein [Leptobacterium flavescens]NER12231.1 DinB family protein [Leptobacterium flavescens]